jgi:hypothetical protein
MDLTTTLLNGDSLTLSTHASSVTGFGTAVSCSVLLADGVELEVHSADVATADFFFTTTGSAAGSPVRLRGGQELVTGPYGGRTGQGLAYRVELTDGTLFGAAPPAMSREALAATLSAAGVAPGRSGPRLRPTGRVQWSPQRSHDAAVSATDAAGHSVLLDVRRAVQRPTPGQRGLRVRGGWLSRSAPGERVHVVLESDDAVAYGLPPTEDDLALAVDVLTELEISVETGPDEVGS